MLMTKKAKIKLVYMKDQEILNHIVVYNVKKGYLCKIMFEDGIIHFKHKKLQMHIQMSSSETE